MIPPFLHDPRWRATWRALLALLIVVVCVLAFGPPPPTLAVRDADKINHLLAFALLGIVATLGCAAGWRNGVRVAVALVLFGGVIELVQSQLPRRSGEWRDLAADAVGIAIGIALVGACRAWCRPRRAVAPVTTHVSRHAGKNAEADSLMH